MRALGGPAPKPLAISRYGLGRLSRLLSAAGVVLCWLSFAVVDAVLSLMLWSEPHPETILIYTSPMLAVIPWILRMAGARGQVIVYYDFIEIRHSRVLREPIFLHRDHVSRILIDDGATTGLARFPTGDPNEPLLWTDRVVRKQHPDRPLIGDGILPNLAIVLKAPLPMTMARSSLTALSMGCELPPPKRSGRARALLLAMEDLNPVRIALGGWPAEEASERGHAIPPQVAAAAAHVNTDAAILATLSAGTGILTLVNPLVASIPFLGSLFFAFRMVRRRQRAEEQARSEIAGRIELGSSDERATALAAINANFGDARSEGPPIKL
jgi:hypothetical protein